MLVLVLEDFVRLLSLGMKTLGALALGLAKLLKLILAEEHSTHHNLLRHSEASRIHLAEHDRLLLARQHLDLIASASLWLLDLQFVELGEVDVFTVFSLHIVVDDMYIAVTLLSHGEVLRDVRGALLFKVCYLALSELLLGAATHQFSDKIVLVVKFLLIAEEGACALTVTTDREISVVNGIRPIELDIHVVFTRFEVLILFPRVTVLTHFAVFVDKML